MKQAIEAIFENGVFRPIHCHPPALAEGQRVRITVDNECEPESLQLLMRVYDGLSDSDIKEVEDIALDRGNFFPGRSEP